MSELQPIESGEAIELYLKDKQAECAESTMCGHRLRLRYFKRWCDEQDIKNLNELWAATYTSTEYEGELGKPPSNVRGLETDSGRK